MIVSLDSPCPKNRRTRSIGWSITLRERFAQVRDECQCMPYVRVRRVCSIMYAHERSKHRSLVTWARNVGIVRHLGVSRMKSISRLVALIKYRRCIYMRATSKVSNPYFTRHVRYQTSRPRSRCHRLHRNKRRRWPPSLWELRAYSQPPALPRSTI